MEAGHDPASDRHEKHRQDRMAFPIAEDQLPEFRFFDEDAIVHIGIMEQNGNQDRSRSDQQKHSEERIQRADDLIHREDRGYDIIEENHSDGDPEKFASRHHAVDETRGDIDEYRDDQEKQQDHENSEYGIDRFAHRHIDQGRQVRAFVAKRHHARCEIMDGAADDIADRDDQEDDLAEFNSQDHADHGSDPRDIQQLDQHVFPVRQDHIIHAVVVCYRGSLPVIRTEDVFHESSVPAVS